MARWVSKNRLNH